MNLSIKNKNIEIFCGTGGVGKTTLATSRALYLSRIGKQVLVITIDPSKRLKQVLDIDESDIGKIKTIDSDLFYQRKNAKKTSFDALLMAPLETLKFINQLNNISNNMQNPILKILMRPSGGLNEIMSIVELNRHLQSNKYDSIILDTPPGQNFIDFLEAGEKIHNFFDKSFMEIFKKFSNQSDIKSHGLFSSLVSSGINKLLSYLEKVTGDIFVNNFIDAMISIYKAKDSFLEALSIQEQLKTSKKCNWFLVTSIEQQKITEALSLKANAKKYINDDIHLLVNKSLTPFLAKWELNAADEDQLLNLKNILLKKEQRFKDMHAHGFKQVLFFPEILCDSPKRHVFELNKAWEN
ncbi:MAG: hypothetical protein A2381_04660 [Bdellovibrionales bacterium RIFOXYB1_FULL_37_110]|nr:MAG: hypothetical protein A2181_01090 [Bdellovibrionales bacterium RIFOXYA1_FULL_38_20]OFZ50477.1 MAG: hypothetical protein A2417_10640 [Bdellovibrionales bacterium RIFOXYC1_FULL_37_79]OFZ56684.1 MAG: hypothetical protein A2328_09400 [Bdellovibrionales bacterium RIFOXYB2_FULL_36_6]OFZ60748.1 MAG: hypothetical protein A2381_04660 [Bdellovibrionales bacterium RIFOXYB1_FULL_37_110]OFZ64462.1 MAG: hypothetical protein A2577_08625 [Bdellovibrionales bacterium RIFOXYD1_FULL_36_51]